MTFLFVIKTFIQLKDCGLPDELGNFTCFHYWSFVLHFHLYPNYGEGNSFLRYRSFIEDTAFLPTNLMSYSRHNLLKGVYRGFLLDSNVHSCYQNHIHHQDDNDPSDLLEVLCRHSEVRVSFVESSQIAR